MLRPAHHGFHEIAVVEIDLEWHLSEIGGGEPKGWLRQVDTVIVTNLGSAQRSLHRTGVAAGNVEEAEGRRENVVQGFSKDIAYLTVGQVIAFDQLAVRGPLLLELRKSGGVHHCAAGLELMDMNVYQSSLPPHQNIEPQGKFSPSASMEFPSISCVQDEVLRPERCSSFCHEPRFRPLLMNPFF
jgi:hypothetical protein